MKKKIKDFKNLNKRDIIEVEDNSVWILIFFKIFLEDYWRNGYEFKLKDGGIRKIKKNYWILI